MEAAGAWGEDAAAAWYEAAGFTVMSRNWCCPQGELDLVVHRAPGPGRRATLVFVEVKARSSERFGTPAEALTPVKRRRVRRAASAWLAAHRRNGGWGDLRFDLAAVTRAPHRRGGTGGSGVGVLVEIVEDAM